MLRLIRTETKADWDFFHEVPRSGRGARGQHSRRDASSSDEVSLFHFAEHSFFRHGLARGFVVLQGDRPVARLAAFVDADFVRERKERVGFLGFFSNIPDCPAQASVLLVDAAREWLQAEGMSAFLAPVEQSFWSGWGWTREDEAFWRPALAGLGAQEILRVSDYKVDLDSLTWPIEIESRAEIAAQSTRARLVESGGGSPLQSLLRPLERALLPSAREKRVRKDLQILQLVQQSTLNCQDGARSLPWDRTLNRADWLKWRENHRYSHVDLEIEIAGAFAGWASVMRVSDGSFKRAQVSHVELSGAYKDFDLLPWVFISVTRWALEDGIKELEWRGSQDVSAIGVLLKSAFPHVEPTHRHLVGGAWGRTPSRRD